MLQDQMKTISESVRLDTLSLKSRAQDLETQYLELRTLQNQKVSGQDVADIVDRKLQVLQDYKRDVEAVNVRCQEVRVGFGSMIVPSCSPPLSGTALSSGAQSFVEPP
jgi:hypothetical protein